MRSYLYGQRQDFWNVGYLCCIHVVYRFQVFIKIVLFVLYIYMYRMYPEYLHNSHKTVQTTLDCTEQYEPDVHSF